MRFLDLFRPIFERRPKVDPKAEALAEIIAAMSRGEAAMTERVDALADAYKEYGRKVDELAAGHKDLVQQVGTQNREAFKQFSDLRAIITQLGEQAKQKPAVARNMADIRRFTGENDAD